MMNCCSLGKMTVLYVVSFGSAHVVCAIAMLRSFRAAIALIDLNFISNQRHFVEGFVVGVSGSYCVPGGKRKSQAHDASASSFAAVLVNNAAKSAGDLARLVKVVSLSRKSRFRL